MPHREWTLTQPLAGWHQTEGLKTALYDLDMVPDRVCHGERRACSGQGDNDRNELVNRRKVYESGSDEYTGSVSLSSSAIYREY